MDIAALQVTLRRFAAERGWGPFHTPKNLTTALLVEAAELAEIFQWLTPEQSAEAGRDVVVRNRIGEELADVLLYLAQVADHTGVDIDTAVAAKLAKNAGKHPPPRPGLPTAAAVATGTTAPRDVHVLIDWENVQPKEADLRALVPDSTDLWLFHGPQQRRVGTHHPGFGERVTLVPIARTGKNALDFHLTFYIGYIAARHPDARFVVLSNDQGYAPMLAHARQLGFDALAIGFGGRRSTAAKARKASAAARTARTARTAKKAPAGPATEKATKAAKRPPAKKVATDGITAKKSARAEASTAKKATAVKVPRATAARTTAPRPVPAPTQNPRQPSAHGPAQGPAPVPAPVAGAAAVDPTRIARRLAEQLRAMTEKQRPTRRARLLGFIGSRLDAGTDAAARLAVLEQLVAQAVLEVDAKGGVRYP